MSQSMPLREHFRELRTRALVCMIALLIGAAVCFYFYEEIYAVLLWPARHAATTDTVNPLRFYQDFNLDVFRPAEPTGADPGFKPVRTEVTEFLSITVRVSLLGGFVLALPVILYNAIRFVAPGLTPRERKILFSFLPAALLAFAGGMAFGYFVMIPPALSFLIGFGSEVADPLIRISNLVNIMIRLLFWLGLSFETPLVMYVLAVLGVVNARSFARFRRFWLVAAFVIAAAITPTIDPLNQAIVAGPLIVLYEVGILLARLAGRRSQSALNAEPASE